MPKVSAIISAYYCEQYIAGAIMNLMFVDEPTEIIVVCQSGSDEEKIAQATLRDAPLSKIITTPCIPTIYKAWNLGIRAASGKYVTNANSDDRVYPDSYHHMAMLMDKELDVHMVYGDVRETQSKRIRRFEGHGLSDMLDHCYGSPMPMWRKEVHDQIGYFDESYHVAGDLEFWLRMLSNGYNLEHCGFVVGDYSVREDSAEHREPLRTLQETMRARSKYKKAR
jgi:glycosyltransferase involved in cell wall biosynthesis